MQIIRGIEPEPRVPEDHVTEYLWHLDDQGTFHAMPQSSDNPTRKCWTLASTGMPRVPQVAMMSRLAIHRVKYHPTPSSIPGKPHTTCVLTLVFFSPTEHVIYKYLNMLLEEVYTERPLARNKGVILQ